LIGNTASNKDLIFFTGGISSSSERMRMTSTGRVGIATTSPTATMDIAGTFKLGSSGTVLNNLIKGSITVNDATTFNYTSTLTVTATVSGATVNGTVIVNPRSSLPAGIGLAWSRVSAANTVTIAFTNTDVTSKAVGNIIFDVTIIQ
jgi:hypothetical protein